MKPEQFFFESSLATADVVAFAKAFQVCLHTLGKDQCWCMRKPTHRAFEGFISSHGSKLLYKNQDARPLLLAFSERYYSDERPVIVRRGLCQSKYCLNPSHYYYGTRRDVALENEARNPKTAKDRLLVTGDLVDKIRQGRDAGETILRLSRKYKVPYHVARRICSENAYADFNGNFSEKYLDRLWQRTIANCLEACQDNPKASRAYNLAYHVSSQLECPWHRAGFPGHKGNFGLMGECLDCMEEIKKGRCTVDVAQFSIEWYWTVKRFWSKVDIKGEDECWPWLGAVRPEKYESITTFPSPFHSGKTQSASRVAFWLARGYTGKYRVFSKPDCVKYCCNPKHLTMRELKDVPEPAKISEIRLNHGNIFEHYKQSRQQGQPGSAEQLPLK